MRRAGEERLVRRHELRPQDATAAAKGHGAMVRTGTCAPLPPRPAIRYIAFPYINDYSGEFVRQRHVLAVLLAVAALGPTAPGASAGPLGDREVTIFTPDTSTSLRLPCKTSFDYMGWPKPFGATSVQEIIGIRAESSTDWCADAEWRTRVTVIDDSPGHPTRTQSSDVGVGNPSITGTSQVLPYGLGVREVGIVTYQFEATSYIADWCAQDLYLVDWVTRTSTWLAPGVPC